MGEFTVEQAFELTEVGFDQINALAECSAQRLARGVENKLDVPFSAYRSYRRIEILGYAKGQAAAAPSIAGFRVSAAIAFM